MLVTKIPYFREVVLMSFSCPFCGHKSNEVKVYFYSYILLYIHRFYYYY